MGEVTVPLEQDPTPRVNLRMAWAWMCPVCGQTLFAESESLPMEDEVAQEAREALNLDVYHEGEVEMVSSPTYVSHCGRKFRGVPEGSVGVDT